MFVKKFSHVAPPVSIEELKTVQTANGRFYLTPGKRNYPSVTTVCRIPKKPTVLKSVEMLFTKPVRTI